MLWDRAEANGYAHHLTDDPLPNTPPHDVLLIEAFGDHQVANVATETMARTIGAKVWSPPLAPGRTDLANPFWALDADPVGPVPRERARRVGLRHARAPAAEPAAAPAPVRQRPARQGTQRTPRRAAGERLPAWQRLLHRPLRGRPVPSNA
ncbi:MAG: hypothetical protein KatS3mg010_1736 [Acidimicrobiia bacterium]|nr:MAG: hypothetical protein KatS3mg010_1736 [Acidimicrobiia bacterium]